MKRIILYVLISLVVCIINTAFAQSGLKMFTSGYVRDKDTNKPIVGAEVVLINENNDEIFRGLSNEQGFYEIGFLGPGEYHFSIGPVEGSGIFIGVAGENSMDYYKLKIVEGKNVFLNFFLGKSDHIYFKREDTKAGIINFTMAYADIDIEAGLIKDTMESSQNQFNFYYFIGEEWIDDIFPGDGHYYYSFKGKYEAMDQKCDKGFCNYKAIGVLYGIVYMHTDDWYKDKNPTYPSDNLKCLINCLRIHENIHKDDSIRIGQEFLDTEVVKKSGMDPCCKNSDCLKKIIIHLERWKKLCNDFMRENGPSEMNAKEAQKKCEDENKC